MRCKHENACRLLCVSLVPPVEHRRCPSCGAWLSLGESNDEPEAVKVELRGTAIASEWREQSYRPGADRFEWCPETKSDELCDLCQAHVLAHAIAEHQTQDPTE